MTTATLKTAKTMAATTTRIGTTTTTTRTGTTTAAATKRVYFMSLYTKNKNEKEL